jgi:hypothetical protein
VPWDPEKYKKEVLLPARKSGLPADLFVIYGFDDRLPGDQAAFSKQVSAVAGLWRSLENKQQFSTAVKTLKAMHAELENSKALNPKAFQARRDQKLAEAERQLNDLIAGLNATHVGPDIIATIRQAVGGAADERRIRRALQAAKISVIDELPDLPHSEPAGYSAVSKEVRALGKQLTAEVVFGEQTLSAGGGFRVLGGFRLANGKKIDDQELKRLIDASEVMSFSDPRKTPTGALVTALRKAIREGTLDRLLLWDIIAPLREQVGLFGSQKALAGRAIKLGLDRNDAGIIAVVLASGGAGDFRSRQVEEDLAAKHLRAAQSNAAFVDDELRAKVDAAVAKVDELAAKAEREQAAGRTEQAAKLLAEATALAVDDEELPKRLREIAPPVPRDCFAVVEGGEVIVTWRPGAGQVPVGEITYQVTRGTGRTPASPAQGITVGEPTSDLHVTDADPTTGSDLRYAIFAGRGGPEWSAAGAAASVVYTPEVTDIKLRASSDAIIASWRAPKGATQVKVTRQASGRETAVPADLTGFHDTGLTAGVEYVYQITAMYRSADGAVRGSAGVIKQATPTPDPLPVPTLSLEGSPPEVKAVWEPPKFGRVELLVGSRKPTWRLGAEPAEAELKAFGTPVPGAPRQAGKRMTMPVVTPPGRHYLLAVTRAGHRAVIGAWTELNLATPVKNMVAERLGDQARLSWTWPEGAVETIIAWPGGERRSTWHHYHAEGGFAIPAGPDEMVVSARAVHPDQHSELVAAPVSCTVPGRKARVSYHWLRAGPLHAGRRVLELTTDRACQLPELVVVQSTAKFPPDEPDEGIEIVRLPPVSIAPGTPVKVSVDLPKKASGFLACFIASKSDGGPLLFPPPPAEMKIK